MKNTKKIIAFAIFSVMTISIVGCSRTVTGNKEADGALSAFNSIVNTYPDNKGFHKALQHWGFKLPIDDKFEWTKDTSANAIDYAMIINAEPLIKAGLDVKKLDASEWVFKPAEIEDGVQLGDRLVHPFNVSDKKETSNGSEDALRRILKQKPDMIRYHEEQQHYRLLLGEGFEVQWTQKLGINNADMSFVIKADSLIKAGLDIKKLEGSGWMFKAAGDDHTGMGSNPDELIKIYTLKS